MLTTVMKFVAIAMLLVGMFWHLPPNLRSYIDLAISAGAVFVLIQAAHLRQYWWVAVFVAVACLFNPIQALGFSFKIMAALQVISMTLFAVSLPLLRTGPRLTIASITEANPKTESL